MISLGSWLLVLTSLLSQVKSSSLKSCPESYYLSKNNQCKRCMICSRKQEMIQKCAALSDTVCLCPSDTFHHQGTVSCMTCNVCDVGEVMEKACSPVSNTVCLPCGKGFTSKGNNSVKCTSLRTSGSTTTTSAFNMVVLLLLLLCFVMR